MLKKAKGYKKDSIFQSASSREAVSSGSPISSTGLNYSGPLDSRFITYVYYRRLDLRQKVRNFIPKDIPCTNVIDIGTGTGVYLDAFDGGIGVDLLLNKSQKLEDRFQVLDITRRLPFKDNQFDFAIAIDILEHLEKPIDLLKEINRITKFGFVAEIPVSDEIPFYYDPVNCYRKYMNKPLVQDFGITQFGHIFITERKQWESMFSSAGFSLEKHEHLRKLTLFECCETLFYFIILKIFSGKKKYEEIEGISKLVPGVIIRYIHKFYSLIKYLDPEMNRTVFSTWFCKKSVDHKKT